MSTSSPPPAPAPTSPPAPPANPPAPPPATPAAPPPATPAAPPPATPSAPPPSNSTSPPPVPSPPAPPTTPPPSASFPPPASSVSPPPGPAVASPPPVAQSPPPPAGRSPPGRSPPSSPSGRTPSPPAPSSNSSSSSISTAAVVGIAVGAVVVLAIVSLLFICCRKKKRRPTPSYDYYGGHPPPPPPPQPQPLKEDPYGGRVQNWQYNTPSPADYVVKLPSEPTPPPPFASRPPNPPSWPPPPPPPPFMSSSGGSGSNYSTSDNAPLSPSPGGSLGISRSTFTFEELARATNGFSDANLLGQGGFGYVHKGVLPNGKEVAIKQLKAGSGQGEREFQTEVEIISRVHHKHLVSLVGYCISGGQRLLVYEFVPNETLEFHLHGKGRPTMDWPTRLKIALGSGKGLAYLHEDCHPKIIHRDIKAANILLDVRFEAKVADFGLAKFSSDNNTHVSTRIMGTFGYLAPEYAASGKLTDKSDVFSFGVMLLELITGRRPVDSSYTYMDDSLVDWARPLLTGALDAGDLSSLVDPKLGNNYDHDEMKRMIACAAACVRYSAKRRPRMSHIVRVLEGDVSLHDLNEGVPPGHSAFHGSYGSSDYDASRYQEDLKKHKEMALGSHDDASNEYSVPTSSDYGLNPSVSSSEGQQTREMELGRMKKASQGFSRDL